MARHTKKNKLFLTLVFVLTAAVTWACPSGQYQSPQMRDPNSHPGSDYGDRNVPGGSSFHRGWDLNTNQGNSSHGGTVQVVEGYNGGHGNKIIVTDGNFRTVYAHACTPNRSLNGQTIKPGQSLGDWSSCCTGVCASSGGTCKGTCNSGMHVHYETQVKDSSGNWKIVDPAVVQQMVAEGKDPCDPNFGDEAIKRTEQKHNQPTTNVPTGPGGNNGPTGPGGTNVPPGGLC